MKKVLNIILSVILCLSVVSPCFAIQSFAETGDETTLKFKNGKFRILVFADPQDDLNPCEETLDLMYASIEAAKTLVEEEVTEFVCFTEAKSVSKRQSGRLWSPLPHRTYRLQ